MNNNVIEWIGHFGAFLTGVTFIPQVHKVWKSKSVNDLSLTMMIIVFFSTVVWLIYAFSLMLWPVILANGIVNILSALLIYFKFAYSKK